jgi:hypothetical protein
MPLIAYIASVSSAIGFSHFLMEGEGDIAGYATLLFSYQYAIILIAYHLLLAVLVISGQNKKGLSLPIGQAVLSHCAFLALFISLPYAASHIPFFSIVRWCIPGLAPFEAKWLFSGKEKMIHTTPDDQPRTHLYETTAEDHEAFREYLLQPQRLFRKPGMTVDDEFKAWLANRASKRPAAPAPEIAAPLAPETTDVTAPETL